MTFCGVVRRSMSRADTCAMPRRVWGCTTGGSSIAITIERARHSCAEQRRLKADPARVDLDRHRALEQ
jgi:hypothetical protein